MKILDLGSGKNKAHPDAITLDIVAATNPDFVHNLDHFPYPFADSSFDAIYCSDVIEHLQNIVKVMEEIHRIGKDKAIVTITTPHFSCSNSFTDPTHIHHLGYFSFDYFTGENQQDFYTSVRFKKMNTALVFYPKYKNWLISKFAKSHPRFYEEHLCWLFPAWFLIFELQIIKPTL
jgi:predicted SAM-dependent methyltransferase